MENTLKEILSQIQTMSNEIKDFRDDTNQRLDGTYQRLTKLEMTLENKTNVKIQALYEDREIVHNKLDIITNELADIKEIVTDHDLKIQVINNKKAL